MYPCAILYLNTTCSINPRQHRAHRRDVPITVLPTNQQFLGAPASYTRCEIGKDKQYLGAPTSYTQCEIGKDECVLYLHQQYRAASSTGIAKVESAPQHLTECKRKFMRQSSKRSNRSSMLAHCTRFPSDCIARSRYVGQWQ